MQLSQARRMLWVGKTMRHRAPDFIGPQSPLLVYQINSYCNRQVFYIHVGFVFFKNTFTAQNGTRGGKKESTFQL